MDGDWKIDAWIPGDEPASLLDKVAQTDALVVGTDTLLSGDYFRSIGEAKSLKYMQIPFTGYDWLDPSVLPAGCTVCNVYGHESAMAEFVFAAMLEWEIGLREIEARFRSGSWLDRGTSFRGRVHGELRDKTVGLIGYGAISREIARRSAAFDMTTIAVSRSQRDLEPPLSWYGTMEDLNLLLERSDYVILGCELNEATRNLIDAEQLRRMKSEAVLVNVARGHVVHEESLYLALQDRKIGGAILDVWYQYPSGDDPEPDEGGPPPSAYDFDQLDNVIMTPHCAARSGGAERRKWEAIADNLNRYCAGAPLNYVVLVTA